MILLLKNANLYFNDLKKALETRNDTIRRALEDYRTGAARIAARYSEAVAAEELAAPKSRRWREKRPVALLRWPVCTGGRKGRL